ncbi:MAG: rRNA maturation RNase YbeY [Candidatus Brocadiia bacterium]
MKLEVFNKQNNLECPADDIRRVVQTALEQEGREAELSLALVDDEGIVQLNRRFLGREGVTDVLAFPYGEAEGKVEGEIIVNAELAVRQAHLGPAQPDESLMSH